MFLSAAKRLVPGGAMLLKTGSHWVGVGFIVPVICLIVWCNWESKTFVWLLFSHTGAQYSALEYTSDMALVLMTSALDPHDVHASFWMMLLRVFILAAVFCRCFL